MVLSALLRRSLVGQLKSSGRGPLWLGQDEASSSGQSWGQELGTESGGRGSGKRQRGWERRSWEGGGVALSGALWLTFKQMTGLEKVGKPEADEVMEAVEKSKRLRGSGRWAESEALLQETLSRLQRSGRTDAEDLETRLMEEMGMTALEAGQPEKAAELFKLALTRIQKVHGRSIRDEDFISCSLHLADALGQLGRWLEAERGLRQCLVIQDRIVANRKEKLMYGGAIHHEHDLEEQFGPDINEHEALLGRCLDALVHFLLIAPPPEGTTVDERLAEAFRLLYRSVEHSVFLYGPVHSHTINVLNSAAVRALQQGHFAFAALILEDVTRRVLHNGPELAQHLPAYYCNYAEALFHAGQRDKALDVARRALIIAEKTPYHLLPPTPSAPIASATLPALNALALALPPRPHLFFTSGEWVEGKRDKCQWIAGA